MSVTSPPREHTTGDAGNALSVPALRAEALRRGWMRPGGTRAALHIAGIVGAWAGLVAIALAVDTWWIWPPVWLAVAFLIVGLAGVGHDCVHGTVAGRRWVNTVLGHAVMMPVALPFGTYRQFHLLHHADTVGPDDPEGPPGDFTSRGQYLLYHLLLGPGFLAMVWWSTIRGAVGRPPRWARTEHSRRALRTAWMVWLPGVVALGVAAATSDLVRHVWLYPWLVTHIPVLPFVLLSEHYGGTADDGILRNTYTIASNPITRFAVFNINFHTAHHLLPKVPSASLRRLDAEVRPHASRTAPGYLAFHRRLWTSLPWRAPRPTSASTPEHSATIV
jgi:fatty acid desaturase